VKSVLGELSSGQSIRRNKGLQSDFGALRLWFSISQHLFSRHW